MMKKKWLSYAMAGVLTVGALAGIGTTSEAFAHAGSKSKVKTVQVQKLDATTQAKVDAIMKDTETKLAALGVTMPKKVDPFANLDTATQTKVQELMAQHKAGTLTQADFETQLTALGVTLPQKGKKDLFANLDTATQTKVQELMAQHKAGILTQADFETQLKALGVTLPQKGEKDPFANLDAATKEKAQAILDDAKSQLDALGVEAPGPLHDKGQGKGFGKGKYSK